ncbi:YeeE/YedE family protein [Paraglaciecola aquimarina]|uniref:YeeE/YedE family protein n=1 Tax=Paraglaciecola algarum TaxID=3050085 RepID=A0ABS9DDC1_9ALTE|nr:YeeE/YedE family protein [Paraglaciecola sp. G1-23]MCF2950002.1 YeeE/YedE family protein [Paraglaciecola sp. G1-23]
MKYIISAAVSGLILGLGLVVSGMVDPVKVIGFLDLFGNWDPTLAFVMGGGLCVYLPIYHLVVKPRGKTLFDEPCQLPNNSIIDIKLIIGSVLFGLGWGLSGICPGPALVNLSGGQTGILAFVLSMLLGMILTNRFSK